MLHIRKEFPGIVSNDDIPLQMQDGDAASWFMIKKATFGVDKRVQWGFFG